MTWAEKIINALTSVTDAVSHGYRLKSDRYIVWAEDAAADFYASNGHAERAMTGTADLYTPDELDPWVYLIGEAFDDYGICWRLNSVQYEDETAVWHYEWEWGVEDG